MTDARGIRLGSLAHLGGILLFPPALLIWLATRSRDRFAEGESKEALNWQITFGLLLLIVDTAVGLLQLLLFFTPAREVGDLANALPWLMYAGNVVLSVIAFRSSRQGRVYRYPVSLRLVR